MSGSGECQENLGGRILGIQQTVLTIMALVNLLILVLGVEAQVASEGQ